MAGDDLLRPRPLATPRGLRTVRVAPTALCEEGAGLATQDRFRPLGRGHPSIPLTFPVGSENLIRPQILNLQ